MGVFDASSAHRTICFRILAVGLRSGPVSFCKCCCPFVTIHRHSHIRIFHVHAHSTSFRKIPPLFAYLALFLLATAFLTALGRLNYGLDEASAIRYRLPSLIFWACVLGLFVAVWNGTTNYVVSISLSPSLGFSSFAIVLVPAQRPTIKYFANLSTHIKNESIALAFDPTDRVYEELFSIRPDLVRSYAPFLRENHLSIFANRLFTARGEAVATLFIGTSSQDCFGSFEGLKAMEGGTVQSGKVFGWGWLKSENRGPATIVVIDENQTIVGLAQGLGGAARCCGVVP